MLRDRVRVCAPFQSVSGNLPSVQLVRVQLLPTRSGCSRPHLLRELRCGALDNRGSQQPFVASPGSRALPFSFSGPGSDSTPITSDLTSDSDQPASSIPEASTSASGSWETWLKVFEQLDMASEQQEQLRQQLQDAVLQERYSQAAALKQQLDTVQSVDAVAAVQRALAQALEEERYKDAATLRDQGMAWMQGWWRGVSANDSVGHLMHVVPEFGRYTGRVYTARDLADLAGLREGVVMGGGLQQLRAAMQVDSSTSLRAPGQVGSPALEVFVMKEGRGEAHHHLRHQVVSLMGAAHQLKLSSKTAAAAAAAAAERSASPLGAREQLGNLAAMLDLGLLMRLSVTVDADGSAVLRASTVDVDGGGGVTSSVAADERTTPRTKLVGWDAVEAAEDEGPSDSSGTASLSGDTDEDDDEESDALAIGRSRGEARVEDAPSAAPATLSNSLNDSERALVAAALASLRSSRGERNRAAAAAAAAAGDDSAGQMVVDVHAAHAVEIDATHAEDGSDGDDARHADACSSAYTELHRAPADLERLSVDQFVLRLPHGAGTAAVASPSFGGSSSGIDEPPVVRFEILVPAGKMMLSGASGSERAAATVTAVAERVARVQARRGGRSVNPEALRSGLKTLLRGLEAGKPVEVIVPADADVSDTPASAGSTYADPLVTTIRYTRIPPETGPRSDSFSGLYVGSFGPHGPELLRLRRVTIEGEDMVEGVKITGDTNVPAGHVSFRAKIGRKHKQSSSQVYPDELGVTARYKGQGHVAGKGYSRPKWVEGELLVFSSNSPLTNGAQLGFVWHVPGERKFLILLNQVDLQECVARSQQQQQQQQFST